MSPYPPQARPAAVVAAALALVACDGTPARVKPWRHAPDPLALAEQAPRSPALAKDDDDLGLRQRRDHTLRIHVDAQPRTLHPLLAPSVWSRRILIGPVFQTLVRYAPPATGVGTGNIALTKVGTGTLTLAGNNAFTGGTTLSAGSLNANSATALGTGNVAFTGGTLAFGFAGIHDPDEAQQIIDMLQQECRDGGVQWAMPCKVNAISYDGVYWLDTSNGPFSADSLVIASGGLSSLDDIRQLCAVEQEGISAAIAGRAIYDGSLDFALAQAEADRATQR